MRLHTPETEFIVVDETELEKKKIVTMHAKANLMHMCCINM